MDKPGELEVYLQRRIGALKIIAHTHQGRRYRYFMLQALEHDAALDALYFVQSLLRSNTIANWDDCLLGRLGQIERLYAENWPAIARRSTSPRPLRGHPSPSQWRGAGGEVEPLSQALMQQLSMPSLDPISRLRLEAGVAALKYLGSVLASPSQRTIIAALLGLERSVLDWWEAQAIS